MRSSDRIKFLIGAGLVLWTGLLAQAQTGNTDRDLPAATGPVQASADGLNYLGGDAAMPPFSDSVIDENSEYRRALFRHGIALRLIAQLQYAQNVLDAPVPADAQVYVGQRPFEGAMLQPILTADLRQFHLHQAQLYMGSVWNWVSWNPAGPKSLQLWDLFLYKAFGENRVAVKTGYLSNGLDFVGFFVGGSTATGAQGVYAILPYEVGMSYFPLNTPSVNVQVKGPQNTYFKTAAQRSLDPNGGPTEVQRNHTGFRFAPHGDKLLSINEAGYLRAAKAGTRETWFRAGYMHNFTAYRNAVTERNDAGNNCAYALMDYQFAQSNLDHPNQGLYLGASAETAPQSLNPYARYYELRLYKEAPFRSRPSDVASLLTSRTGYSKDFTNNLAAAGKTVWRASTSLTGSYSLHAASGNYLGLAVSYIHGPAITPRTPNALNLSANWTTFF
ncbi:MAG: carbohydrate porin [Acidobacteriota bacterium]|nr:carbohydrate porin [Acidobacteriota bacterium]